MAYEVDRTDGAYCVTIAARPQLGSPIARFEFGWSACLGSPDAENGLFPLPFCVLLPFKTHHTPISWSVAAATPVTTRLLCRGTRMGRYTHNQKYKMNMYCISRLDVVLLCFAYAVFHNTRHHIIRDRPSNLVGESQAWSQARTRNDSLTAHPSFSLLSWNIDDVCGEILIVDLPLLTGVRRTRRLLPLRLRRLFMLSLLPLVPHKKKKGQG